MCKCSYAGFMHMQIQTGQVLSKAGLLNQYAKMYRDIVVAGKRQYHLVSPVSISENHY